MTKLLRNWLPVITWLTVIFTLSHQPNLHSGLANWLDLILRKFAHISEYAILTFLLLRAIKNTCQLKPATLLSSASLTVFLSAILDEIHQSFIPGREGCLRDVMIDSLGILITILVVKKISLGLRK